MKQDGNYLPDVREQYEQYPYPERDPQDESKRLIVSHQARLDSVNHHCFNGRQDFENEFRVLIAGGGTGDALIAWAEQLRDKRGARVTYLDISTASAQIARKRADVRGLQNIDWINDSIPNLPDMGVGPFDFIGCSGVLHHLGISNNSAGESRTSLRCRGSGKTPVDRRRFGSLPACRGGLGRGALGFKIKASPPPNLPLQAGGGAQSAARRSPDIPRKRESMLAAA